MTSIHFAIPEMMRKAGLALLLAIIAMAVIQVDYVGGNFKIAFDDNGRRSTRE